MSLDGTNSTAYRLLAVTTARSLPTARARCSINGAGAAAPQSQAQLAATYIIAATATSDAGSYYCVIINGYGSTSTVSATLTLSAYQRKF